jgi:S-formylglutathione hydrolase FrmB
VVYVDAWTSYGGSQFVDSPGTGRYHSYLCDEILPWVDARYRTLPGAAHRAIMGHSSGGFGAMITPMLRPGHGGIEFRYPMSLAWLCGRMNRITKPRSTEELREIVSGRIPRGVSPG